MLRKTSLPVAITLAIAGFALIAVGTAVGLAQPGRPDLDAARRRLERLQHAVETGQTDAATALAASLAVGLGADAPAEIGPDLDLVASSTDRGERERALAHAAGLLDGLAAVRPSRTPAVLVTAGAVLTLAAFSAGLRTIRRLRRTIQADALRRRLPAEPVRPRFGRDDAPAGPLGRILEIRAVDDP